MWLWRVPMFPMKEAARRGCHLDVFLGAVDSVLPPATCCGWIFCVPVRFYLFIISRLGGKIRIGTAFIPAGVHSNRVDTLNGNAAQIKSNENVLFLSLTNKFFFSLCFYSIIDCVHQSESKWALIRHRDEMDLFGLFPRRLHCLVFDFRPVYGDGFLFSLQFSFYFISFQVFVYL